MNCKYECCKINILPLIIISAIFVIFIVIITNIPTEQKSILSTIAVPGDNTAIGPTVIKFSKNEIEIGPAMSHTVGSENININESGIYQISYQVDGERQTPGTFNFNCILLVNGNPIDDTENETPILKDDFSNRMTNSSTVILKLNAGDTLSIGIFTIEEITYPKARMDIEKIY